MSMIMNNEEEEGQQFNTDEYIQREDRFKTLILYIHVFLSLIIILWSNYVLK